MFIQTASLKAKFSNSLDLQGIRIEYLSQAPYKRKTEKEIGMQHATEHVFYDIQKLVHLGSFEFDIANNKVTCTEEIFNIFGIKSESFSGTVDIFLQCIHSSEFEKILRLGAQAIEDEEQKELDCKIIRPDGESKYINIRFIPIFCLDKKNVRIIGTVQDITERAKEEERLRRREPIYQRLENNISDMIWVSDIDLNLTYISPSVEKVIGESKEKHIKRTLDEKFPPNSLSIIHSILSEEFGKEKDPNVQKDRTRVLELEQYKADGSIIWVEINISFIRDVNGTATGFLGISRDITESKKAERELNRFHNLLKYIVENNRNAVAVLDKDFKYLYASKRYLNDFIPGNEDIIGRYHYDVIQETEKWNLVYIKVLNGEVVSEEEELYVKKDGSYGWACWECRPWHSSENIIGGIILYIEDITNRKVMEKALKESENRYHTFIDASNDMIFLKDEQFKHIVANKALAEFFGRTTEEILGRDDFELMPEENAKQCRESDLSAVSTKSIIISDEYSKNKIYESIKFPVTLTNQNTGIGGFVRDITERKQALEALQESERSKSVLLSNIPGMAYRCLYDEKWTMEFVSDGCYELTGYKPESLIYNNEISFCDIICIDYRKQFRDVWTQALESKTVFRHEHPIKTASGEIKWVFGQGQGVFNDKGEVEALEGLIIDISDLKKKEEEILYINHHDALTDLYNRQYFDIQKKQLDAKENLPFSIIVGDINGLKLVNDAYGHEAGDKLIVETANLLRKCCRDGDVLGRIGSNEFSVILPKTDKKTANNILQRIQSSCRKYNEEKYNKNYISLSLGYETKENNHQDLNAIIKSANEQMYKHKLLEQQSSHSIIISSIKATMLERNMATEEHAERLISLARTIGLQLNLSQTELDELELLATLHDIGKVGIEDRILNKHGKLTSDEWIEMEKHPEIGYRIAMTSPELVPIAKYILYHHERWDGEGYPVGLSGTSIPLLSRIIAIVDAYDAMTQDRTYRKAMSKDAAIVEITANAGTQFDPDIATVFITIMEKDLVTSGL